MSTRDQGNGRVRIAIGTAASILDLAAPTVAEANALLNITEAVRWDGYDFGAQESDQIDDRSVADSGTAQLRGFAQFGGAVPLFYPKRLDTGSILRQAFNLLKTGRTELILLERVGFKDWNEAFAAGDNVNVYRIMNDGFNPDTEGDGGYAYIVNLLPLGDIYSWTKIAGGTKALVGAATANVAIGSVTLRGLTVNGENVTARSDWSSTNDTIASVAKGVIVGRAVGTATITATFPGTTGTATVTVTVP